MLVFSMGMTFRGREEFKHSHKGVNWKHQLEVGNLPLSYQNFTPLRIRCVTSDTIMLFGMDFSCDNAQSAVICSSENKILLVSCLVATMGENILVLSDVDDKTCRLAGC
jgi:hypothetical protein